MKLLGEIVLGWFGASALFLVLWCAFAWHPEVRR